MNAGGDYKQVGTHPAFVAVVYPAAMREILTHILLVLQHRDFDDAEKSVEWVDDAVAAFARKHGLLEKFKSFWAAELSAGVIESGTNSGSTKGAKVVSPGREPWVRFTKRISPNGAANVADVSAFQACAPLKSHSQGSRPGLATLTPLVLSDFTAGSTFNQTRCRHEFAPLER